MLKRVFHLHLQTECYKSIYPLTLLAWPHLWMVPYLNEGRDKTTCNFDEKNDSSDQSVVDSKFSTEAVDVDKIESNSTQTNFFDPWLIWMEQEFFKSFLAWPVCCVFSPANGCLRRRKLVEILFFAIFRLLGVHSQKLFRLCCTYISLISDYFIQAVK